MIVILSEGSAGVIHLKEWEHGLIKDLIPTHQNGLGGEIVDEVALLGKGITKVDALNFFGRELILLDQASGVA